MSNAQELMGFRAESGMSRYDIECRAMDARALLVPHLGLRDPVDGSALIENLAGKTVRVNGRDYALEFYVEGEISLPVEARCKYGSDVDALCMELSERTYASLEDRNPRALFTVAHELGHLMMHGALLLSSPDTYRNTLSSEVYMAFRRRSTHRVFEDTEWQANAFAAAFIMPANGLTDFRFCKKSVKVKRTQDRFNVSKSAAEYRWETITRQPELMSIGLP